MRLLAFIIALLLLAGTVDPTRGWLIALVVVSGLAFVRPRFGDPLRLRPAFDIRCASFVLAVLLLAGTIDATRDWLIGMAIVSGVAAFMPRLLSIDLSGHSDERRRWSWFEHGRGRRQERWARRADRHWERVSQRWGDEWP
jgi:hypothetical protein